MLLIMIMMIMMLRYDAADDDDANDDDDDDDDDNNNKCTNPYTLCLADTNDDVIKINNEKLQQLLATNTAAYRIEPVCRD